MKHLGREEVVRVFAGTAFQGEEEHAARHLVGCGPCSALAAEVVAELAARQALAPGKRSVRVLADLLREKEEMLVRSLQAKAWVEAVRVLPEAEQARAVRDWKDLRSRSFLEAVIEEATARAIHDPEEGEDLARFGLSVADALEGNQLGTKVLGDLRSKLWAAIANARRLSADWPGSSTAIQEARLSLATGTGDLHAEARLLSVEASLLTDLGRREPAVSLLKQARSIYVQLGDQQLVARTLLQVANTLRDVDPQQAYEVAGEALGLLDRGEARLVMMAQSIRIECLIELGEDRQALFAFQAVQSLYVQFPESGIQLRVLFMEARLLETFGKVREAEKRFEQAVQGFWEARLYKDSLVDRLYLFAFHVNRGALVKAERVCKAGLKQLASIDAHPQMKSVWTELLTNLQAGALDAQALHAARSYMALHWRVPAEHSPLAPSRGAS
jgi:tetratricopeptide (TPR) repeat protein